MRVPPIMISKGLEPWTRQITTVQPHHDSEFVNRKERSNLRVRRLLLSDIDATGTCTGEAAAVCNGVGFSGSSDLTDGGGTLAC